jgi:hypothetical protein
MGACRVKFESPALLLAAPPTLPPPPTPTPIPTPTPDPDIPAPEYWTLDSTPLVGPDAGYCAEIGYTDFRSICPVRQDQSPERKTCEAWVMGRAKDTGTPGPTWYWKWEQYCTDLEKDGCEHDETNPYSLHVLKPGWYQACHVDKDICGRDRGRQVTPFAGSTGGLERSLQSIAVRAG